ncbi:MAG: zinc-binding dehydrogenase [Candidatus Binatia bacterium]
MKALQFRFSVPRYAYSKLAGRFWPDAYWDRFSALAYRDIRDPWLRTDRWVRVQTQLSGICGSDMSALFLKGSADSPLTPFVSFPMVLGHEIVGRVVEVGAAVRKVEVGQRVVINPMLSCTPRGIDPPCVSCQAGQFSLCRNFAEGSLPPGLLIGSNSAVNGGYAPFVAVHEEQCIRVPDDVSQAHAVLTDPIAVTLRSILRHPPGEHDVCLVYGCGILGLGAIACLRALHPHTQIVAVAKYDFQGRLAQQLGAGEVLAPRPESSLVSAMARLTGARAYQPMRGKPILMGGVQRVYDCIGSAATIETSLRLCAEGGTVVVIGVDVPKRVEWSPLWFRELNLAGSMAVGTEQFEGRRLHTYEVYLHLVRAGRLDVENLLTHRFSLAQYRDAFTTCSGRGTASAVKVAFAFS